MVPGRGGACERANRNAEKDSIPRLRKVQEQLRAEIAALKLHANIGGTCPRNLALMS